MIIKDRVQLAIDNFMAGYGCCQSVVAAYADLYGLDHDMALRTAAGFGAGVGRMRMMCGAVSGLVILAGLDKGQTVGNDRQGKQACYALVQNLLGTFKEFNGSIICSELLQMAGAKPLNDNTEPDERNAEYYSKRPCARKVAEAASIFAQYLESKGEK